MRWLRRAASLAGVVVAVIAFAPLGLYLHFVGLADTAIVPGAPEKYPPAALDLLARSLGCDEQPVFESRNVYSIWFHNKDCELTIASQVARQMLPRHTNMAAHHATSAAATLWVTRHWSAEQALAAVLERSYFGRDAAGLDAAARKYFALTPSELTPEELAQLIAATHAPSRLDPWCRSDLNKQRANRLLERDPATAIESRLIKQPAGACSMP